MKKHATRYSIILPIVALCFVAAAIGSPPHGSTSEALPASLDAYYPPRADAPVWLLEMAQFFATIDGIVVDQMQGDVEGARANYEAFRAQYEKVSGLVPEWKERFPSEPVEALGAAIASGETPAVMAAIDAVGVVCHNCHLQAMAQAHFRYSWADFADVEGLDPLTQEAVPFAILMRYLGANFIGITNDLRQGQPENAAMQFQAFKARFEAVGETCQACHDSERRYFVDSDIRALIDEIGTAVASADVDAVGHSIQKLGYESCRKCHLVHIPGAYSKQ
jgi:cytochrome c556